MKFAKTASFATYVKIADQGPMVIQVICMLKLPGVHIIPTLANGKKKEKTVHAVKLIDSRSIFKLAS